MTQNKADGTASERLRDVESARVVSRRGVLWRTGAAGAAGAVALTALDERRADAATGGNFILGQANSANVTTELSGTASPVMQIDGSGLGATGTTLVVTGPTGGAGLFVTGSSTGTTTGLAISGSGSGTASGVFGSSSSGAGVTGVSTSGTGITGSSSSGTGVLASSTTGNALSVNGRAHFSRSGVASVAAQHTTRTVSVPGMTSSSLVIVTLQAAVSGLYLLGAVPASGKFTVRISKKMSSSTKFAWFVLN